MFYNTRDRNHVILPGREKALHTFLNQELDGKKHKLVSLQKLQQRRRTHLVVF